MVWHYLRTSLFLSVESFFPLDGDDFNLRGESPFFESSVSFWMDVDGECLFFPVSSESEDADKNISSSTAPKVLLSISSCSTLAEALSLFSSENLLASEQGEPSV